MNPDNARIPRITAAAGTELADACSPGTLVGPHVDLIAPWPKQFKTRRALSCTRHGWFRVASIDQYSSLLPPVGVWAVSQSQCGGASLSEPLGIVAMVGRYPAIWLMPREPIPVRP